MSTVDIVIKSYPPDFEWLHFCLRSIAKYGSGFRDVLLIVPPGHGLTLTREKIVEVPGPENYKYQQVCKLNADLHQLPNAEYVLNTDSDCCFTRSFSPESFMRDGKPIWFWTPWSDLDAKDKKAWYHVVAKCVQEAPPGEFMRRHPSLIPTWAYSAFREFIEKTHGMSMDAYVMNQPGNEFSEFNCIGFYLYLHHRDKISWWNTKEEGVPPAYLEQYWSLEPIHAGTRAWLQACLA